MGGKKFPETDDAVKKELEELVLPHINILDPKRIDEAIELDLETYMKKNDSYTFVS